MRPPLELLLWAILLPAQLVTGALISTGQQQFEPLAGSAAALPAALGETDAHFSAEDLGDSMLMKGRYQRAVEAYQSTPNKSSYVWNKLGIAFQMLFDLKDASRCYKESLRLQPANAWTLNNLGTVYESQGKNAEAEKLFREGLRLEPDSARIAMNLGTVLMIENKFSEGADMYKRALGLDPDVFEQGGLPHSRNRVPVGQRGAMNYYKAKACASAGMNECAIKFLGKALREGFTDAEKVAQDENFVRLHGNAAFDQLILRHSGQ